MRNNNVACRRGPELPLKPSGPGTDFAAVQVPVRTLFDNRRAHYNVTVRSELYNYYDLIIGPLVREKKKNL